MTSFGLREILAVLGLLLLAVGLALYDVRLSLIVSGALLFTLAVWPLLVPPRRSS